MDDFLTRLYRMTEGAAIRRTEDFVSLCLGRLLARDVDALVEVLRRIEGLDGAPQVARLAAWAEAPVRRATVAAQVLAESGARSHAGWADLRIVLDASPLLGVVLEAKIGAGAPTMDQVHRYARAFPEDLVVALVPERAKRACPPGVPVLTWDDVADALGSAPAAPPMLAEERRELLELLLEVDAVEPRRAMRPDAWQLARRARLLYSRLMPRLQEMLLALAPTELVRGELAGDRHTRYVNANIVNAGAGWGPGVLRGKSYSGTAVKGLALAVCPGGHANEIRWLLEAAPSRAALVDAIGEDRSLDWYPARGGSGWVSCQLGSTTGDRSLDETDLAAVLATARDQLRALHQRVGVGSWDARGEARAPSPGEGQAIPALHAGMRAYLPVQRALLAVARDTLASVARLVPGEVPIKRSGAGWQANGPVRIWCGAHWDLHELYVVFPSAGPGLAAALASRVAAHGADSRTLSVRDRVRDVAPPGPALVVTLDDASWRSPELVPTIATIARDVVVASPGP